jgi:predicted permease
MSLRSQIFTRRERMMEELDQEIRDHIARETEDNIGRGMPPEEARYAAIRKFGGIDQVKEECRDAWGLRFFDDLLQDVRFGVRQLRRNPGFTAVAVMTLALGIGANTAIFSVVDQVLLRSMPYKDPNRLVMVWETYLQFPKVWPSVPNFQDWQAQNRAFEAMGAYRVSRGFTLTGHGEPERVRGTYVSSNLFGLLGVEPAHGRSFLPAEDKPGVAPVVILSHALWQRLFGSDSQTISQIINFDDRSYTVVGVMPPGFQFPEWADFWMPFGQMGKDERTSRVYHPLEVVARLKPAVTRGEAQVQINTTAARLAQEYPKTNGGWGVTLVPLRDELVGNVQPALLILLGATGLVLLIACANVTNLMLARTSAREKEMAVRLALGSGRSRLMRQLLTECLTLSSLGGALGLLFAFWGRDLLLRIGPSTVPHLKDASVNGPMLGFSVAISILTCIIFGLIPALQSSIVNPNATIKQSAQSASATRRQSRFRGSFVVVQMSLALILLVGAGLLLKSFVRLLGVDPGFDHRNILTARVDLPEWRHQDELGRFYERVSGRLKALPGVKSVGMINYLPLGPDSTSKSRFVIEGDTPSDRGFPVAELRFTNPDYFHAMRIPLLKGRLFKRWEEEQKFAIIIGSTLANRYFPNQNPLGKRLNLDPEGMQPTWCAIVGVVGDVRDFGLANQPQNDIYFDGADSGMYLVLRTTSDPLSLALAVRRAIYELDGEMTVRDVNTGDQMISHSLASRRFTMILLGVFACIALSLAVIGIYAVMSYTVALRTHEIGIRMALGAERLEVLRLVVGRGMGLAFIGVAIGLIGALSIGRFIAGLLYGVKSTDPLTLAGVSLILIAVSLIASYVPARRATKVDPMVALRHE